MKKFLVALMALSMVGFVACSKDDDDAPAASNQGRTTNPDDNNSNQNATVLVGKAYKTSAIFASQVDKKKKQMHAQERETVYSFLDANNIRVEIAINDLEDGDGTPVTIEAVLFTVPYTLNSDSTGSFSFTWNGQTCTFSFNFDASGLTSIAGENIDGSIEDIVGNVDFVQNYESQDAVASTVWEIDAELQQRIFASVTRDIFINTGDFMVSFDPTGALTYVNHPNFSNSILTDGGITMPSNYSYGTLPSLGFTSGTITFDPSYEYSGPASALITSMNYVYVDANHLVVRMTVDPTTQLGQALGIPQNVTEFYIPMVPSTRTIPAPRSISLAGISQSFTQTLNGNEYNGTMSFTNDSEGTLQIGTSYNYMGTSIPLNFTFPFTYEVSGKVVTINVDKSSIANEPYAGMIDATIPDEIMGEISDDGTSFSFVLAGQTITIPLILESIDE